MAESTYITIGKLVERLKLNYPDLTLSKVRYLEDEGLITPVRTQGGYRLFSPNDIKRIETILYLQKNRFMPLSVIKEELDETHSQEDLDVLVSGTSSTSETKTLVQDSEENLSKLHPIERIPELCGISVAFVQQLAEVGLIAFSSSPHGRTLVDGKDLPLIRAADALRRYGFEAKNLRPYTMAANRESGVIMQALAAYVRRAEIDGAGKRAYNEALDTIIELTDILRDTLIRNIIAKESPSEKA